MNDRLNRTALHNAVIDGEFDQARTLLDSGTDVNAKDAMGWAPLHFAAQNLDVEMVRMLLAFNANIDATDEYGNTPLSKAVFNYRGEGNIIELLRKSGADPKRENNSGVSPLTLARMIANYDVSKYFADFPEQAAE